MVCSQRGMGRYHPKTTPKKIIREHVRDKRKAGPYAYQKLNYLCKGNEKISKLKQLFPPACLWQTPSGSGASLRIGTVGVDVS
jgi:hypothetical protein